MCCVPAVWDCHNDMPLSTRRTIKGSSHWSRSSNTALQNWIKETFSPQTLDIKTSAVAWRLVLFLILSQSTAASGGYCNTVTSQTLTEHRGISYAAVTVQYALLNTVLSTCIIPAKSNLLRRGVRWFSKRQYPLYWRLKCWLMSCFHLDQ